MNTIFVWLRRNYTRVIIVLGIVIILILGYLFFGGSSPDANIHGGGFGTLIASGLIFWGAYKGSGSIQKILGAIATILLVVWIWPRIFPFLDLWGFAPNFFLILAILAFVWMWKGGKGLFGWRMFLVIFLVLCWVGAKGAMFKTAFNAFTESVGIEFKMPTVNIPVPIKNVASSISNYAGHLTAQTVSQSKERLVKNGAKFYDHNGTKFATKQITATKDEFIKVFILDEQVVKDGLTFEKVRLEDPAIGEDVWVYSGILLSSPEEKKLEDEKVNSKISTPPEWEKVGDYPINFLGRIFDSNVGPNGERPLTGEVYTGCKLESGYVYKVTFSGEYSQYFIHPPWYNSISWQGWQPQLQTMDKPFPDSNYGALMLRIGNRDGLFPKKGEDFIFFTATENNNILAELNITRAKDNYSDPTTVGSKIRNSTLSIKLERRPL